MDCRLSGRAMPSFLELINAGVSVCRYCMSKSASTGDGAGPFDSWSYIHAQLIF